MKRKYREADKVPGRTAYYAVLRSESGAEAWRGKMPHPTDTAALNEAEGARTRFPVSASLTAAFASKKLKTDR